MTALANLKMDIETKQNTPGVPAEVRDALENQYQAVCQKQAEWESGNFWTPEKEKNYLSSYKQLDG